MDKIKVGSIIKFSGMSAKVTKIYKKELIASAEITKYRQYGMFWCVVMFIPLIEKDGEYEISTTRDRGRKDGDESHL